MHKMIKIAQTILLITLQLNFYVSQIVQQHGILRPLVVIRHAMILLLMTMPILQLVWTIVQTLQILMYQQIILAMNIMLMKLAF